MMRRRRRRKTDWLFSTNTLLSLNTQNNSTALQFLPVALVTSDFINVKFDRGECILLRIVGDMSVALSSTVNVPAGTVPGLDLGIIMDDVDDSSLPLVAGLAATSTMLSPFSTPGSGNLIVGGTRSWLWGRRLTWWGNGTTFTNALAAQEAVPSQLTAPSFDLRVKRKWTKQQVPTLIIRAAGINPGQLVFNVSFAYRVLVGLM